MDKFNQGDLRSCSISPDRFSNSKGPIVYYVPRGGGGFGGGGGGTILKQAPFWGVNFSLVRNMRGVKFYDTATAV